MSDKRKLSSILGICGATVLAAGGSAFLTDTGLSLMDRGQQIELETETDVSEQETELPISVEQFTKSKDSFVVSVKRDTPAGGTASDAENANLMYATGDVNMRSSAGTDGDVLDTLPSGAEVTATGNTQGGWTEVTYNGQTGYVSSNYLAQGSTSGSNAGNGSGSTSGSSTGNGSGSTSGGNAGNGSGSTSGSSTGNGSGSTSGGSAGNGSGSTSGGSAGNGSGSTSGGSTGSGSGSTAASWTVTPSSGTMYATWDVNVRSGASKDNSRLGGLSNGEAVTVTGYTDNGWIQVSYNGQTGYVAGNYLSWDKPTVSTGSSGSSNSGAWDDSYIMSDINSRYVSESELNGWSSENLAILRNEIFARHGRIFTTQKWSNYFAQKTWYVPTYDPSYFDSNMSSFLNEYERANLDVILKVEAQ